MENIILRKHKVLARLGLSSSTLWRKVKAGDFPPPRQLGENSVGWLESEVETWILSRKATVLPANNSTTKVAGENHASI